VIHDKRIISGRSSLKANTGNESLSFREERTVRRGQKQVREALALSLHLKSFSLQFKILIGQATTLWGMVF
jgi:hypothetical protein